MQPTIRRADFADPRLAGFLQEHLADMEPTAPPESRHALDLSGLTGPDVRMWVVLDGSSLVGTGAPARSLYARAGFEPCAPFGSYVEDPNSVFMTTLLAPALRPPAPAGRG